MCPMPIVVFIGPPASGKSKVGRRVAALLNAKIIDTDKVVEAAHGPIKDIFEHHGEETFREYEREAVHAALQEQAVVSLGGGAILNTETQNELSGMPVVLMDVSAEAVKERVGDPKRPLLKDGMEAWNKLYAERDPIYRRLATYVCDTSDGDLDRIASDVVCWLSSEKEQR